MAFRFGSTKEQNQAVIQALSKLYGAPITNIINKKSSGLSELSSNGKYLGSISTEAAKNLIGPVQGPTQSGATLDTVPQNTTIGSEQFGPSLPQSPAASQYPAGSNVGPYQNFTSDNGYITPLQGAPQGVAPIGGPTGIYDATGVFDPSLSYGGSNASIASPSGSSLDALLGLGGSGNGSGQINNAPDYSQPGSSITFGGASTGTPIAQQGLPGPRSGAQTEKDVNYQAAKTKLFGNRRKGILSTILSGDSTLSAPLLTKPTLLGS